MKRSPRVVWVESTVHQRYSKSRILDVGFVGRYKKPFVHLAIRRENPEARVVGVDVDLDGLLRSQLLNTVAADGRWLPFRDGSFDAALCLELLEHLYCPVRLLLECWRVLRPDGELVITTPNAWAWWNFLRHWMGGSLASRSHRDVYRRYLGDHDHKQFYEPLSLLNVLDDTGFQTIALATKNHALPVFRRYLQSFDLLDLQFFPMNRLGHYICLVAQKRHSPRVLVE